MEYNNAKDLANVRIVYIDKGWKKYKITLHYTKIAHQLSYWKHKLKRKQVV